MNKNFLKNIDNFKSNSKRKLSELENKPFYNMRSINEYNIKNINHSNFIKILNFIIDDIKEYKEKVKVEKYFRKYAPKDSLKEEQIIMLFSYLVKLFKKIMKKSGNIYYEAGQSNPTALNLSIEIFGNPEETLKIKREGLLKTYSNTLLRVKQMLLLLDTQIEENNPEEILKYLISNIEKKELFLPLFNEKDL